MMLVLIAFLHLRPRYKHFVVASRPRLPLMGELFGIGWPVGALFAMVVATESWMAPRGPIVG